MTTKLLVNEVFYSLQGEGARVGQPSIFIRLSGCNLACPFCDTEFVSGVELTLEELLAKIKQYPGRWIVWTGGEPLLQLTKEIIDFFRGAGYSQALETNGSRPLPVGITFDWLVVSPKVASHVLRANFPSGVDELRYPWSRSKTGIPQPPIPAKVYYLSPVQGPGTSENLRHCIELCKANPQWRLSFQAHKLWNIE